MSDRIFILKLGINSFDFPNVWYFDDEKQLVEAIGVATSAGIKTQWHGDYITSADELRTGLREAGRLSQEKL